MFRTRLNTLPSVNQTLLTEDIKALAKEATELKRQLKHFANTDFSFKAINKGVIDNKKKMTLLCSLQACSRDKVHLLNDIFDAVRTTSKVITSLGTIGTLRGRYLKAMIVIQEEALMTYRKELEKYFIKD